MEPLEYAAIRDATERFVRDYMPQFKDSSHDWRHIQRVRKLALEIANAENARTSGSIDLQLVELASLLHDVGDKKFLAENESTVDCLRTCMTSLNISLGMQDSLIWIIERVSFRAEVEAATKRSKDGEVAPVEPEELRLRQVLFCVQDADRLDAIGAIGIARCFSFNGARNLAIYEEDVEPIVVEGVYPKGSNARNHFFGKWIQKVKTG